MKPIQRICDATSTKQCVMQARKHYLSPGVLCIVSPDGAPWFIAISFWRDRQRLFSGKHLLLKPMLLGPWNTNTCSVACKT